jgi:hypothetical protein
LHLVQRQRERNKRIET